MRLLCLSLLSQIWSFENLLTSLTFCSQTAVGKLECEEPEVFRLSATDGSHVVESPLPTTTLHHYPPPTTGTPTTTTTTTPCLARERDGWLGRSAFTLTKRTC